MKDVMVDLETLGTTPGSVVLSIGAVAFDPFTGEQGPKFYEVIKVESSIDAGLTTDPSTIDWWGKQSEEARRVLTDAQDSENTLTQALESFTSYLVQFGLKYVRVWGNGADFDNPILSACYNAAGLKQPWSPWNGRCYRTLKNILGSSVPFTRHGTYHNALDDAISQADHAAQIFKALQLSNS